MLRNMKTVLVFVLVLCVFAASARSDPWWSSLKVEESKPVLDDIQYQCVLYQKVTEEPVRAHILSVTGVGTRYIFGVLGSFGALFPPSAFAKQSGALVVINGSYFSKNPTRGLGLIAAHNRILYPPSPNSKLKGTVGFTPDKILFDWIGVNDIQGNRFQTDKPGWNDCHAAIGAGPLLIKDGTTVIHEEINGFNRTKIAPRTAIAVTQEGFVLLVVIDGRQPDWSSGVTLDELTELLLARQVRHALNLDGGGSSTMVVQNEIINRPSDYTIPGQPGKERAVANVIALFKK